MSVPRLAAPAVLVALWLAFWWPFLAGSDLPYVRDVLVYALPMKHHLAERIAAGELPLWSGGLGAGAPYLADPANQTLYPLNLVYLIAPDAHRGLAWSMALHGLLAAFGARALARALGATPAIAAWAALVYAYSGYTLSISENVNYLPGVVWLPVALACLVRAFDTMRGVWVAGAAAALACLLLAGDLVGAGAALGLGTVLAIAHPPRTGTRRATVRRVAVVAAVAVVGMLIGAAQILPALELQALSVRAQGISPAEAVRWSLPPARIVEFVQPYPFGSDYADRFLAPDLYPDRTRPWADSIYVGLVPVALAALGAVSGRLGAWLAVGTLASLALALGRHTPVFALASELPLIGAQRYPEKMTLVVTLLICMLAALGAGSEPVRRWLDGAPRSPPAWTTIALVAATAVFVALPAWRWLGQEPVHSALWSALLPGERSHAEGLAIHTALAFVSLAALFWALLRAPERWRARTLAAVLAFGVADLVWVHRHAVPGAPATLLGFDEPSAILSAIDTLSEPGAHPRVFYDARRGAPLSVAPDNPMSQRVAGARAHAGGAPLVGERWLRSAMRSRAVLERNLGLLDGVRYLNGEFSPLQTAAHERYDHTLGAGHGHLLMALSGVRYVITPITPHALSWDGPGFEELARHAGYNVRLLEVRTPLARAYLAGRVVPWNPDAGLEQLAQPGVASGEVAVVELRGADEIPGAPAPGSARMLDGTPEKLRIEVRAGAAARLVVTESLLPGWQAHVGGELVPIERANGRFMSLAVPAGIHLVELTYRPPGLTAGLAGSSAGLLLMLIALVWRRRTGPPGAAGSDTPAGPDTRPGAMAGRA